MNTKPTSQQLRGYYLFFGVLAVVCAVVIVTNIAVRRAPAHDSRIETDLNDLQINIETYAANNGSIPAGLSDLQLTDAGLKARLGNYTYRPTRFNAYQLCATFAAPRHDQHPYAGLGYTNTSDHGQGYQCLQFRITAQPGR